MDHIADFFKMIFIVPEKFRLDGFILYLTGMFYYAYLHCKHDKEMVKGLKGDNGLWEAPEAVVYYWLQAFPFILFADAFLGLILSDGMMIVFTLILLFAIMGRAGVEMMLAWKTKITGIFGKEKDQPKQAQEGSDNIV